MSLLRLGRCRRPGKSVCWDENLEHKTRQVHELLYRVDTQLQRHHADIADTGQQHVALNPPARLRLYILVGFRARLL